VEIDQALWICTNGRIEDLRIAAEIIKGKKVAPSVRMIVVPASSLIYRLAEEEGLLGIFAKAGAFVSGPTCAACLGGHMGVLAKGERCVPRLELHRAHGHKDSEVSPARRWLRRAPSKRSSLQGAGA
jgi:3-isopropylmalate/(R)-2-methylmalate dehydratase large subunit